MVIPLLAVMIGGAMVRVALLTAQLRLTFSGLHLDHLEDPIYTG